MPPASPPPDRRPPSRPRARRPRAIAYLWAAPATVLGLAAAVLELRHGSVRIVDGVIEVYGPSVRWALRRLVPVRAGAAALTLGHVVLGVDAFALDVTRSHERVHVRQYERWGPLFIPAYFAASVWAVARGRDGYRDNVFECDAFRAG